MAWTTRWDPHGTARPADRWPVSQPMTAGDGEGAGARSPADGPAVVSVRRPEPGRGRTASVTRGESTRGA